MMEKFRAILISKNEKKTPLTDGIINQKVSQVELTADDLPQGDVTIRVAATTVNYKDGLAITGRAPVVRCWPMVPGIDLAGTVIDSQSDLFVAGDEVLLNGWGIGEKYWGGHSGIARVKSEWLLPLPAGISMMQAMAVGTAGYTAMLCVMALERHGVLCGDGPIIVSGASGGVASIAIALLSGLGFDIIAATGRSSRSAFLKELGAREVIDRAELCEPGKILGKERWSAGIDVAGSHTLANMLAQTQYGGAIAACGLVQGSDLPVSVMPFILRGCALLGINSVITPLPQRQDAWNRISSDLDKDKLARLTSTIGFDDIIKTAADIVDSKICGRVVVDMSDI